jgi:murein DD-endopeptidase MepM/ murein hydrolase activator NlpD
MGRPRATRMSAALLAACLLAAPASTAGAAEPPPPPQATPAGSEATIVATGSGGATAPDDAPGASGATGGAGTTGGAQYGAVLRTPAPTRPVATRFSVATGPILEGSGLRIGLRIDEPGVSSVRARLVFLPVGGQGQILRVDLGRVATGQDVTPSRVSGLAPGRYVVRLHVKDPHGATLRRRAHSSGRAELTVRARPAPKRATPVSPTPPKARKPSAGAPLPVVAPPSIAAPASSRGTFPVTGKHSFGGEDARFGAGRPGHIHQGQDVVASSGVPVVAPMSGTVTTLAFQASGAGQYVVMRATDGRSFFFAHLVAGSTAQLKVGQGVSAGQQLGRVGSTGESSGPHLHFEIWEGGWRVNPDSHPVDPLAQLLAWDR